MVRFWGFRTFLSRDYFQYDWYKSNFGFLLSETRAWYSFFTILGLMSLISISRVRLRKKVYLTFGILMGSFLIGRTLSFFLDNSLGTGTAIAFANEFIVFVIAYWRYTKRDFIF